MNFLQRLAAPFTRHVEGAARPGPWYLPLTGGWLPADVGRYWNWWQMGFDPVSSGRSAMVEACIGAYAQTIAMCPGDHWRALGNGGRERVSTSAISRILRRPNDYQSISDFLLNAVWSLYSHGNAYTLALRNERSEADELHLMDSATSSVLPIAEDGSFFKQQAGYDIIDRRFGKLLLVPARNVLHIRLHAAKHPLVGASPIEAAAPQMAAGNAALQQQIAFYLNQARPSIMLTTDQALTAQQITDLRDAFADQSRGDNAGKTPVLARNLKPTVVSTNAVDAQLAEILKLNDEAIAAVFRVPLQILGRGGTPFASTEALMQSWKNGGLGFALNHIEEALGNFVGLKGQPDEYIEFDTSALLRSSQKEFIETQAAAVRGGLKKINEARFDMSLPSVDGGDDIRVQQQDVPLTFWQEQQQAQLEAAKKPLQLPPPQPKESADGRSARISFRRRAYADSD